MTLLQQAGAAVLLVLAYAIPAVWRRRSAHHLDKKYSKRDSEGTGISLRCARHANHVSCHHSARNRHSAVVELLSLALPSILGIRVSTFPRAAMRQLDTEMWCFRSKWRLLGPLESMVGMLMSGVSIGLLFAAVTHLVDSDSRSRLPLRSEPVAADPIGLRQRRRCYFGRSRSNVIP